MISVLLFERDGRWRVVTLVTLLLLAALPLVPLCAASLGSPSAPVGAAFWRSLATSTQIALGGSAAALLLGLPLGAGMAVTEFRGKRLVLALMSLPLVVPSFLW